MNLEKEIEILEDASETLETSFITTGVYPNWYDNSKRDTHEYELGFDEKIHINRRHKTSKDTQTLPRKSYHIPREIPPTQPELSFEVAEEPEDIYQESKANFTNKSGNFLFTIGNVSSGKSTIQTFMTHRLHSRPDVKFRAGVGNSDTNQEVIVNKWIQDTGNGIFPQRTKQDRIQEFNIKFGQDREVDVNFIEISGEDIKKIVPKFGEKPKVHTLLDMYLSPIHGSENNRALNKRFMFVSEGEHYKDQTLESGETTEDILFDTFLRYLLEKHQLNLGSVKMLFIVSKWDTIREKYDDDIDSFVRHNFPQTLSTLKDPRIEVTFMPFTVGNVEQVTLDEKLGIYEDRVITADYTSMDTMIHWVYHTYTEEFLRDFPSLTSSFWSRVARWFGVA